MKETKRDFIPYSFYDLTGMERRLERMAQRGWLIDKMSNLGWRYRRIEPKKLHFTVTYYPRASAFEPELTEAQQTFLDFCRHTGWKLAAFNGQTQVFYNEEEDPLPIDTDPGLEIQMIGRTAKKVLPAYFVMLVLGLWMGAAWCYSLVTDPIGLLAGPLHLFSGFVWLLLFLYFAADLISYFNWRRKAKVAAQRGEFVPTRGCHPLLLLVLAATILGLIYVFLTIRLPGLRLLLGLLLLGYVLLFATVNGTTAFLKYKKVSARCNRAITIAVDAVLALVLMGLFTFGIIRGIQSGAFSMEAQLTLPLKVEDLVEEDTSDYKTSTSYESSVFLSQGIYRHSPDFQEAGATPYFLSYTVVDVKVPFLYGTCFNQLYHHFDDWDVYIEGEDGEQPYYVYQQMTDPPAGVDTAYQLWSYGEPSAKYLLCYPDRLVTLDATWYLTDTQMDIAAQKLAP